MLLCPSTSSSAQDPEAVFITLQHALPDKYLLVPWEVTLEQSPVGWPFYDTLPQGLCC